MNEAALHHNTEAVNYTGLESMLMDPLLRATLDKIHTYNQLLSDGPTEAALISEIIREIDAEVGSLTNRHVVFTGRAEFPYELHPAKPRMNSYFEEETMKFCGVESRKIDTPIGKREPAEGEHYAQLRISLERHCIDHRGELVRQFGYAEVDGIATMEFDHMMSFERARGVLEALHPELLEDIDSVIYQETDDECVRALGLANIAHPLSDDEETDEMMIGALNVYTNQILGFDRHNGYGFSAEGVVWTAKEEGDVEPDIYDDQGWASVSAIHWLKPADDTAVIVPHLEMRVGSTEIETDTDMQKMYMPLSSLKRLSSLRREYFGG